MKRLFLSIMFLSLCSYGMSQSNTTGINLLKDVRNIDFYGVDFSFAKTYGAGETVEKFAPALEAINGLLISESDKYNLAKFLQKEDVALHIKHLKGSYNKIIDEDDLLVNDDTYAVNIEDIQKHIKGYSVDSKYEIGAVLVAELLNKKKGYTSYYLTFFNNDTKNIIATYHMKGKARGFGLRNYWAGSVLDVLERAKKAMK